MNIIETLPKTFENNGNMYTLEMHVTVFDKLCICYKEMLPHDIVGTRNILCSVCVEPENKPLKIEDTIGFALNEYVGNARTIEDAAKMLKDYVYKTYINTKNPNTFWNYIDTLPDNSDIWRYAMNISKKYHNEGKNPDDYLDEIINEVENVKTKI